MRPSEKEKSSQSGRGSISLPIRLREPICLYIRNETLHLGNGVCADDIDELSLDAEDLLSFSFQVAKGMEYITSKNVGLLTGSFRALDLKCCCEFVNQRRLGASERAPCSAVSLTHRHPHFFFKII